MYNNPFNNFNQPFNFGMQNSVPQLPLQQQQPQPQSNIIYVSGIEDVRLRQQPNFSVVMYFDNDKSLLYKKTVDGSGHFDIETFDITEHKTDSENKTVEPRNDYNEQFINRKEFDALSKEIADLKAKIGGMNNGNATNNQGNGTRQLQTTNTTK